MIKREGAGYTLYCDYCSHYIADFENFKSAVDYKKTNKWKSINKNGEWFDKCENCIKEGR